MCASPPRGRRSERLSLAIDEPALAGVCARLLGRPIGGVTRLAGGRNSQVFRLDCADGNGPAHYVAKHYFAIPEDPRDRLQTEYRALEFVRSHGIATVPTPIAMDLDTRCAVYEFAPGDRASLRPPAADDLRQAVELLSSLKAIARHSPADAAGAASEACFSIDAIGANLNARVARLRALPASAPDLVALREFLTKRFAPFLDTLDTWTDAQAARAHIERGADIPLRARTLSPSDFGFHNALRDDNGRLVFVDFEYFGWDDPAKTIVDFLLHPAMTLTTEQRRTFASSVLTAFADVAGLAERARLVYPWFGLKWCLIFLNEFVPEHQSRRSFAGATGADRTEILRRQLARAEELLERLGTEYRDNHLLQ
jgi:hypothetical protein